MKRRTYIPEFQFGVLVGFSAHGPVPLLTSVLLQNGWTRSGNNLSSTIYLFTLQFKIQTRKWNEKLTVAFSWGDTFQTRAIWVLEYSTCTCMHVCMPRYLIHGGAAPRQTFKKKIPPFLLSSSLFDIFTPSSSSWSLITQIIGWMLNPQHEY